MQEAQEGIKASCLRLNNDKLRTQGSESTGSSTKTKSDETTLKLLLLTHLNVCPDFCSTFCSAA